MSFANLSITTDREAALDAFVAKMEELFPGIELPDGDLLLWLAEWIADEYPDLANLTADMTALAFGQFGEQVLGVAPIAAAAATADTTWTLTDSDGHTIPEGTQVQIADGDTLYGFATTEEVVVPAASSATAAGEVPIRALVEGEIANDLSEDPTIIDALAFVDSIAIVGTTSGGVDAETDEDYLDRLSAETKLLSRVLILPADVATAARRVAGVERATVVDGYDPVAETYDNEKMVSVYPIDEDGANVSAGVKTAVEEELESRREVGFEFHVEDPERTTVDVDYEVTSFDGVDTAGLETACDAAISDYLSPSNWGLDPLDDDPGIWNNQTVVYINELISLLDRVEGVDRVVSVEISENPAPTAAANLTLNGPAPLPEAGTITGVIS